MSHVSPPRTGAGGDARGRRTSSRDDRVALLYRNLRGILWTALALGLGALSLTVRQVDLGWQLPDGLAILHTHHLPVAPTTAFGLPATPYVDEYSLYEIALAALYAVGGLGALHAAFAAVFLLIFALPFAARFRQPRDLVAAALVALCVVFVINRFEQRPEVVGVLLLAVLLRLLLRTREMTRGFLLRLALLFAVWSNVHSSYLLGLLALAMWLVERACRRGPAGRGTGAACIGTFALAGAAVLINPYGPARIAFTFAQQRDPGSNLLSPEMWPVWDQPAGVPQLMLLAAALLIVALISRPRPPLWLGALAVALLVLTAFNIRHMSFLAGALLFIAARRRNIGQPSGHWVAAFLPLLAASCVAVVLFDFVALRGARASLCASPQEAVPSFAPAVVRTFRKDETGAVLCHDAAGSYLTFARPRLHPYMDSGQGRYADATKRLYFFAVYDAEAFERVVDQLPALDAVLVTAPVDGWTLALSTHSGWRLAAAEDHGLLFRRIGPASARFDDSNLAAVAGCRDRAIARDDFTRAFCFSTLIDPPMESLRLLDRSPVRAWTDRFYSFTRAWLRRREAAGAEAFLAGEFHPSNPLLRELLLDRFPSAAPLPPAGSSELEQLARVLTLVDREQTAEARATLRSVPKPLVSALYYTLRGELDPAAAREATAFERWQDWHEGGPALLDQAGPALNARAAAPGQSPASR